MPLLSILGITGGVGGGGGGGGGFDPSTAGDGQHTIFDGTDATSHWRQASFNTWATEEQNLATSGVLVGFVMDKATAFSEFDTAANQIATLSNLVANPDMDSDTVWSKGSGVTISGGLMTFDGTSGTTSQTNVLDTASSPHLVRITFGTVTSGSLVVDLGGQSSSSLTPATGEVRDVWMISGSTDTTLDIITTSFNGNIDKVEIYDIPGIHYHINGVANDIMTRNQDGDSISYLNASSDKLQSMTFTLDPTDAVFIVAGQADAGSQTLYAGFFSIDGPDNLVLGNGQNGTFQEALFVPGTTKPYDSNVDNTSFSIFEMELDYTVGHDFTLWRDDSAVSTATSISTGTDLSGDVLFRIMAAGSGAQELDGKMYYFAYYEGTRDTDYYAWLNTYLGSKL